MAMMYFCSDLLRKKFRGWVQGSGAAVKIFTHLSGGPGAAAPRMVTKLYTAEVAFNLKITSILKFWKKVFH